jgi:hypothetical protein
MRTGSDQTIISHNSVIALHICILLGITELDQRYLYTLVRRPASRRITIIIRSVIAADYIGLASPFDNLAQ